jgi:hypothetical protein
MAAHVARKANSLVFEAPMTILELSDAQLEAYNRQDIDAFCACFAEDVRVLDEAGNSVVSGGEAFRARYQELFSKWHQIGARVLARITLGPHVVEHEAYFRKRADGVTAESGEVIVRYTKSNTANQIALVEFLKA